MIIIRVQIIENKNCATKNIFFKMEQGRVRAGIKKHLMVSKML